MHLRGLGLKKDWASQVIFGLRMASAGGRGCGVCCTEVGTGTHLSPSEAGLALMERHLLNGRVRYLCQHPA